MKRRFVKQPKSRIIAASSSGEALEPDYAKWGEEFINVVRVNGNDTSTHRYRTRVEYFDRFDTGHVSTTIFEAPGDFLAGLCARLNVDVRDPAELAEQLEEWFGPMTPEDMYNEYIETYYNDFDGEEFQYLEFTNLDTGRSLLED